MSFGGSHLATRSARRWSFDREMACPQTALRVGLSPRALTRFHIKHSRAPQVPFRRPVGELSGIQNHSIPQFQSWSQKPIQEPCLTPLGNPPSPGTKASYRSNFAKRGATGPGFARCPEFSRVSRTQPGPDTALPGSPKPSSRFRTGSPGALKVHPARVHRVGESVLILSKALLNFSALGDEPDPAPEAKASQSSAGIFANQRHEVGITRRSTRARGPMGESGSCSAPIRSRPARPRSS
jgi:hypothetical protein